MSYRAVTWSCEICTSQKMGALCWHVEFFIYTWIVSQNVGGKVVSFMQLTADFPHGWEYWKFGPGTPQQQYITCSWTPCSLKGQSLIYRLEWNFRHNGSSQSPRSHQYTQWITTCTGTPQRLDSHGAWNIMCCQPDNHSFNKQMYGTWSIRWMLLFFHSPLISKGSSCPAAVGRHG